MPRGKKPKSSALRYTYDRYIGDDPERRNSLEEQRANLDIALKIHQLRTQAGLTQRQLAKSVGTTASVICRLEDADYEGHSLAMLRRIADALHQRVEIHFRPLVRAEIIPKRELWLHNNKKAMAGVLRGLRQAKARRFTKNPPHIHADP